MKIIVAETAGFCFGVKRAVQMVYESIGQYSPLCTLGPIIHNPQVVRELSDKGVCARTADEITSGAVVIRSHGCLKSELELLNARGVRVIDATCPFVEKIRRIVAQEHQKGHGIIIMGEADHPEVKGINSFCDNSALIINSLEEAENLKIQQKPYIFVAQTTTNLKKWQLVVEFISKRGYNITVFNTICSATEARQKEARKLAEKCDCMLVVGGRESSNTRKLYEICREAQERTYEIESSGELCKINIYKSDVIGISAGASTPDRVIKEVVTTMSELEKLETRDSDFAEEMDKTLVRIKPGQQIKGTVIYADENEAGVSIGYKTDGFISKEELTIEGNVNPNQLLKAGDEIEVEVIKVNDGNGNVILSKKAIEERLEKDKVLKSINDGELFTVTIKEAVKSGVLADKDGITVFIPASQLRAKGYARDLDKYVGQELAVKALEVDTKKRRVVASRAVVEAAENTEKEETFWNGIAAGDIVEGVVRRITAFGAFVNLGAYDGLLHISDISWDRVEKVTDFINIGDVIKVKVLSTDPEKKLISLGYKQLQPKPWETADERFAPGTIVRGRVVRMVPFGAFINLAGGVDGMVHISEITDHYLKNVEEELKVGQEIEAVVLSCDTAKRRISLSMKALLNTDEEGELTDIGEITDDIPSESTEEN